MSWVTCQVPLFSWLGQIIVWPQCDVHFNLNVTLELHHQGCCHSVLVILCLLLAVFAQGKVPFIHVGNQVVSELGPIIQFTKAKVSWQVRWGGWGEVRRMALDAKWLTTSSCSPGSLPE